MSTVGAPPAARAGPAARPAPAGSAAPPVFVLAPPRRPARAAWRMRNLGAFRWAYVGPDVTAALALERALGGAGRRVDLAPLFRRVTLELRDPYIAYVGALGTRDPDPAWWLGPVAEKNPYISTTFRDACYVAACRRLLDGSSEDPLVLFAESPAVRRCLRRLLPGAAGPSDERIGVPCRAAAWAAAWGRALARRAWFLLREGSRLVQCRWVLGRPAPSPFPSPFTAIVTWVDGRCFGPDGSFTDGYFGTLARWGGTHGVAAATVPIIHTSAPYRAALRRFRQAPGPFLIPSAFLRAGDLWGAAWRSLGPRPGRRALPPFQGIDLADLVQEDEGRAWERTRGADLRLMEAMVGGWRRCGVPIARVVYPFENHIWERALIRAVREHFPGARLVGYQHARAPRLLLNYFIAEAEAPVMPLPDRIVTNGAHTAALLARSGYGPARIVPGGTFRHRYLLERGPQSVRRAADTPGERPTILLTPGIGLSEGAELVGKALRAFGGDARYRLLLKCHPMTPLSRITAALGVRDLPAHFEVTGEPIPRLLETCDVLVYAGSTTCLEAIACGVPCVNLLPDADLDLDPLEDFPELRECAATAEDLARTLDHLIAHRESYAAARRAGWEEALRAFFGEVTGDFQAALLTDEGRSAAGRDAPAGKG